MASDFPLGTENSGGIDSAAITAYLAHFLGEPGDRLHSFGFAFCEQEPAYILETSRVKGIKHNYIVTNPMAVDTTDEDIARALRVLGYPQQHSIGTEHMVFYAECARRDIRALFSGFGGDEVVSNSGALLRYELLDSHAYGNLWNILRGDPLSRTLRLLKATTIGRRSPGYRSNFVIAWKARWPHQALSSELVEALGLQREYMETARHDAPYRRINDWILQGLLHMPYIASRFEAGTLLAGSYGVEYRWPLWDARLVQQYLSTPSLEKAGPKGMGRYLHRRAIQDVVPGRIAWKPSKDMGYAALHDGIRAARLISAADRMQQLDAELNAGVGALLDRSKLRRQIHDALQGHGDHDFLFMFEATVNAIRWLDTWLKSDTEL
jgi:asparagine synthase (glutamine-hydrolysing)